MFSALSPRLAGAAPGKCGKSKTFIQTITDAGKAAGLKTCVDAGDINSWPGSGETWFDTSGNAEDWWLGPDGTATNNPAFNPEGTPGGRSCTEYFNLDGTQFFTMKAGAVAWVNSLHHDAAHYALFGALYIPQAGGPFFTSYSGYSCAIGFYSGASPGAWNFQTTSGACGSYVPFGAQGPTLAVDSWHFVGMYHDEANANGFMWADGVPFVDGYTRGGTTFTDYNPDRENFNGDGYYVSPSGGGASGSVSLCASRGGGGSDGYMPAGVRFSMFAAWTGVPITVADFNAFHNELKKRYPS